jgi:hypothetical protein
MTPRSGTSSTLLSQNDFIHHQADIQNGEECVLINEDMALSFSHLAIMVMDANFINIPTRQLASSSSFFFTIASGAIWWANLQQMQMAPSGGHICN